MTFDQTRFQMIMDVHSIYVRIIILDYIRTWNFQFIPSWQLFKVSNRNTRTMCEICSKLTIKTPEQSHWRFLYPLFWCFYCRLWNAGWVRPSFLLLFGISHTCYFGIFECILSPWLSFSSLVKEDPKAVCFGFICSFFFLVLAFGFQFHNLAKVKFIYCIKVAIAKTFSLFSKV